MKPPPLSLACLPLFGVLPTAQAANPLFDDVFTADPAAHVVEKNGKYFYFVTVWRRPGEGKEFAIGVAVSDSPTGPFHDALGKPLISSEMTPDPINPEGNRVFWDDIDPAVFIDNDGQAYLFWGNTNCYWVRLKPSLTELDGEIQRDRAAPLRRGALGPPEG